MYMQKLNRTLLIIVTIVTFGLMAFTISSGDGLYSPMNSSGAPAGYSGDPAGGNKNCTNCHSGPDAQSQADWITSDIPETGYIPGTTYTLTANASGDEINRFGFQISPQRDDGTILGTLVNSSDETKLVSGTDYVTHNSSGNAGTNAKSWTFDWIAPETGSGDVIFYGAFNLADNNGGSSGDQIVLSTLTVNEDGSSGIISGDAENLFNVYPNPARAYIHIETPSVLSGSQFEVYDQSGRLVSSGILSEKTNSVAVGHFNTGTYYLRVGDADHETVKFIKK